MSRPNSRRGPQVRGGSTPARRLAVDVLARIEDDGAYANLALRSALDRSGLDERDRGQVTDLVYGVTRLRRHLDAWWRPFVRRRPDPAVRRALRIGVYELTVRKAPPHAAVSSTVPLAPRSAQGFVNAVLRRVATADMPQWTSVGEELSYPDWIVDRLTEDHGADRAREWLMAMNTAPTVHRREDGYVQDLASQAVAAAVGARHGERVLDLCAAPGGKALWMARAASVIAADSRLARAGLVATNARQVGAELAGVVAADGRFAPFRRGVFDRVLVDAPCSGLGVLARRADARWRIEPEAVSRLAALQVQLLVSAARLVRPGGVVLYSVCTLTAAETKDVVAEVLGRLEGSPCELRSEPVSGGAFERWGAANILAPGAAGDDAMVIAALTRRTDRTDEGDDAK